jgi:hypothetical protein
MSEENVEMPVEEEIQAKEPAAAPAEGEAVKPNIAAELQELGRQLVAATKAALESPEAQELGTQLQRGMEALGKQVNQVVAQARETKVAQDLETKVSEAATGIKERRVVETLGDSVGAALQTVNKTLGQAVEKAQTRAEEAKAKKPAPQQIEVVSEEEE